MNNLLFSFVAFLLLIQSALAGIDPSNNFKLGNGAASDKKITFFRGASNPIIKWDEATQKLRFCNDGVTCDDFGASSGGSSGIEALEQKCEMEHSRIFTEPLSKSIGSGFVSPPSGYSIGGILLEAYTSSASTIAPVWGPQALVAADKNLDSTTNWSVQGAGASLGTSATAKFGAASLSFDKDASNSSARIRYDFGGLVKGIAGVTEIWLQVNVPSLTNLTNLELRIDQDGTNYQAFTTTTKWNGSAITTGWNLLHYSVSSGGVATGTGWNPSLPFRYLHVGVNTATTGQTYTAILVDAILFSIDNPSRYASLGSQFTIYDSTNRDNIVIDSTNTRVDGGAVTLGTALTHSYAAGFGATKGTIYRSTLNVGDGKALIAATDQSGNTLAGAVLKSQEMRLSRTVTTALDNSSVDLFADVNTTQIYPVISTTVSTIVVTDPIDQSADLLSGESVHVFRTVYTDGKAHFIHRCDMTLSGNSTNTASQTTLNGTPCVGTAAGDYVAKNHVSTAYSATVIGANEVYTTVSPKTSPEGVLLYDNGTPYPYGANVWAHWTLGGLTTAEATRNLTGSGPALTLNGSLATNLSFLFDQLSANGWSSSNYYSLTNADALPIASDTTNSPNGVTISFWFNPTGFTGSARALVQKFSGTNSGYLVEMGAVDNTILYVTGGTATTAGTFVPNVWNHFIFQVNSNGGGSHSSFLNGVQTTSGITGAVTNSSTAFRIGQDSGTNYGPSNAGNTRIADMIVWTGGPTLSSYWASQIYRNNLGAKMGFGPMLKYRYSAAGVSGQALTMKTSLSVDTQNVGPFVGKMGLLSQ